MRLWLLKLPKIAGYNGFVVRASTAEAAREIAREIAAANAADEGPDIWRQIAFVELSPEGEAGIVLGSFNAG